MKKLRAVAVKEVRQILRDPLSLVMLLGLPAFMLVLYGFALNFDVRHVQLAVQDEDRSAASRELIATFVNSTYFDIVATPEPGADLPALTERRVAKAVLVIPHGYGDDLRAGHHAAVQLLLDGAAPEDPSRPDRGRGGGPAAPRFARLARTSSARRRRLTPAEPERGAHAPPHRAATATSRCHGRETR